jgi:mannose-6-phosphate isomerase-like protein (cupin superfamily)
MYSPLPPVVRAPGEGRYVFVPGARITFTAIATETGGRFELYEVILEPLRGSAERHVHQHMDELIHVTHGEAEVALGDRMVAARAGSTVFIPRGLPHVVFNRGQGPTTMLVQWSPSGHRDQYFERLAKLTSGPLAPPRTQLDDLGRRFDELPA